MAVFAHLLSKMHPAFPNLPPLADLLLAMEKANQSVRCELIPSDPRYLSPIAANS